MMRLKRLDDVYGVYIRLSLIFVVLSTSIRRIDCSILSDIIGFSAPTLDEAENKGLEKFVMINLLGGSLGLQTPDGKPIYEGDIVGETSEKRKGAAGDDGQLWPTGEVPFIFHDSVVNGQKKIIMEAMRHWEEFTCIKFRDKTLTDLHYIRFRSDTAGCWSSVGRKFIKIGVGQDISLGVGCSKFFTAVHEIGHAIGFHHEHARSDRDQYVKILWDNVRNGMDVQFELKDTRNEEVEYDYRSIMHYPSWAFSKNPLVKNTIAAINPMHQYLIDEEKDSMSFRDAKMANILYKCSEKCPNFATTRCQNKGYLSPYRHDNKKCYCMCPPGFYGDRCQYSVSSSNSYYGSLKCGGNVTAEMTIATPDYPYRKREYESCAWWIQAPKGQRVQVLFEDFSFCPPYDGAEKPGIRGKCLFETVEIRKTADIHYGKIYCGEQIKPGTIMKSTHEHFLIIIVADDQMKGRGLRAHIKFFDRTDNDLPPKQEDNGNKDQQNAQNREKETDRDKDLSSLAWDFEPGLGILPGIL